MKTFKRLYGVILAATLGMVVTSCTDDNDWSVDSAFDRIFGVFNDDLSVNEGDTYAEVVFTGVSGADHYVIEVSTDSLTDDIEMGGTEGSIVYGEDGSITASPDTIRGLIGDTKYYLRIKTMSATQGESKWVYYNNGDGGTSFRTDAEQLFNEPTDNDRGDTWIHLSWAQSDDLTRLAVANGTDTTYIDMTEDMIANAEYTVEGLSGSTTYSFILYYNDSKRGTLNISTMAAPPADAPLYELDASVTHIDQAIIDAASAWAIEQAGGNTSNYAVTIGIQPNTTVDVYGIGDDGGESNIKIPDGMSVIFFGMAGGSAPVLNMVKSIDLSGSHGFVRFENLSFKDAGCQYFINQSNTMTIGNDLSFTDCEFTDFERSIFRMQGSAAKTVNEFNFDNCVATNLSTGNGYSVLYWNNAAYTVNTVKITNSTFDSFQRSFLEVTGSNTGTITIDNCTFYNGPASGKYLIDANNCANTQVSISNTIFSLSRDIANCRGVRCPNDPAIENVYFTNDFALTSAAFEPSVQLNYAAEGLFADPANHDFTITQRDVVAGDLRWLGE